jgi:hypothetical protein
MLEVAAYRLVQPEYALPKAPKGIRSRVRFPEQAYHQYARVPRLSVGEREALNRLLAGKSKGRSRPLVSQVNKDPFNELMLIEDAARAAVAALSHGCTVLQEGGQVPEAAPGVIRDTMRLSQDCLARVITRTLAERRRMVLDCVEPGPEMRAALSSAPFIGPGLFGGSARQALSKVASMVTEQEVVVEVD